MVTLAGVFAWIRNLWTATQVEFHGQYSLERLRNYNAYTTTASSARVFAACLLTPFPCLVQISLIDAVPLERPDKGANANYVHWVRNFACQFLMTAMMLGQFRLCVPRLSLGIYRLVVTSVVATIGSVGFQFLMSCVVGFPLPFGIVAGTPLWFATLCIAFAYYFGTQLRSNARFRADLSNYFAVFTLQVLFTFVLPAYISGLQAIGPVAQNAYLILMPVIKIAFKNWMSKYLRDLDDKRPEIVIFAIEIFNALYVACCMQSAMSFSTTVVLILIDSFQAWLSIRDINLALDEMKVFMDAIPSGHPWERMSFVEIALVIIEEDEQLRTHPLLSWKNNAKSMNGADINAFSDAQRLHFVLKATNLLFTTEFILLVEYTEVIIPIIYSTYIATAYHLPNREYYAQLAKMDTSQLFYTISSMLTYAGFEFLSFLMMSYILQKKLRLNSIRQLAFVLDNQWTMVQSKLSMSLFYVVNMSLAHFGADFRLAPTKSCVADRKDDALSG